MNRGIIRDAIGWKTEWTIHKLRDPDGRYAQMLQAGASMEEALAAGAVLLCVERFEGNVALNEGLQYLIDIITGIQGSPTLWDNTNARIGVGNSSAAEDPTHTGLQGASKAYHAMDATYPQRSGQIGEWRSTFPDGEAEFAWEEFTVVNASDDTGKNLNRKIASKGTKASGESWTASVKITFS
ncbi:MAG: hypothetical protein NWE79_08585 [Candidatus Bathyarchaeota archaeon]|nr:hypothetical protein [Candidatus Bathyarchaeota archaeon]